MRLHIDRFTWIVIAVVVALVVGAVLTVNFTSRTAGAPSAYMEENVPEAPVYNAILAVQNGDLVRARAEHTQQVLDKFEKDKFDPIAGYATNYMNDNAARRVRVISVQDGTADSGEAFVTIVEDNFAGGGLFGPNTWSNQRIIRVAMENGEWKVDDTTLFY